MNSKPKRKNAADAIVASIDEDLEGVSPGLAQLVLLEVLEDAAPDLDDVFAEYVLLAEANAGVRSARLRAAQHRDPDYVEPEWLQELTAIIRRELKRLSKRAIKAAKRR